ncbi:putative membrane protein [Fructobacillus tropaeoli]|uniref:Putative membrane protein n=1 Tax=Fructobacillus tropaeoli TaxID=709323 RepID=A0A3F3HCY5_9LACO|nr:putative membrane protein [Fructobacillus tropaeoli]
MRKNLYRYNWILIILVCLLSVISLVTFLKYPGSLLSVIVNILLGITAVLILLGASYKKSHQDSQK